MGKQMKSLLFWEAADFQMEINRQKVLFFSTAYLYIIYIEP